MKIEIFKSKFIEIVENVENTNYGSIIAQFKLILLAQEFYLTNDFSKEEIIEICSNISYNNSEIEAQDEAHGEFMTNINEFSRQMSILDDFGESYVISLFNILKKKHQKNNLFKECNT